MSCKTSVASGLGILSLVLACGATQAYEAVDVAGGGTLEGRVIYEGRVPVKKIIPTKDGQVCGGPREEPQVYVGPDKGVQDAVVYLKEVSRGKPWGEPEQTPVIDNKDCRFHPAMQIIRAGEIDIHNSDPVLHNTRAFYGRRSAFNVALPNAGDQVTQELPRPGMVRLECDAHGWMLAHVFVADNPYYALTDATGHFSMTDIPPGDYALVATQSYTGDTETTVTVKGGDVQALTIELSKP